jgi:hypothetical protein
MRIVFLPETLEYFNELIAILYEKEYLGFKSSALAYVDELIDDVQNTLHLKPTKKAPSYFNRFGKGMQYATFKKSKFTHWYIFFTMYRVNEEVIYLVRYISNNHVSAQFL